MRILGTGDRHIKKGPRFDEAKRIHAWIADYVAANPPDLFIDGGDVYDEESAPEERLVAAEHVQAIAEVCPYVLTRGNHDRVLDLDILARLHTKHPVHFVDTAGVLPFSFGREQLAVGCLAWPPYASGLDDGETSSALQNILRGLGDEMLGYEGANRLLLTHCMADGAITGTGQPLVGMTANVTMTDLALARAQFIAASHVHMPQHFDACGAPFVYMGSPFHTDFGGVEDKAILEIILEGDRVTWRRIPTPARPMLLFEGRWTGERMEITSKAFPHAHRLLNAEVRFRYTTPADQIVPAKRAANELRDSMLADGAAFVKLDPEIEAITKARVPEVRTKRSLPEKLETMWRARGDMPEPDRVKRLMSKLQQIL